MALTIGSNIASLVAQRRLGEASSALGKNYERLSSGQRINRAADDAAGLAIASKLNSDTRVYAQAIRNVNDGMSYLAIADGALKELGNITQRQIELAEQSANGVYTFTQRRAMNDEANALVEEFNRIIKSTEFNGRTVLDVSETGEVRIQAGMGVSGSLLFETGEGLKRTVGTGEFTAASTYTSNHETWGTAKSEAVHLGDLNGDGDLDMVVTGLAAYNGGYLSGLTEVHLGNGDGTFSKSGVYTSNWAYGQGESKSVQLGDVDGDGRLDMVVAGGAMDDDYYPVGQIKVFHGNGDGTFAERSVYSGNWGGEFNIVQLGDIDGDGRLDIAAAGYGIDGGETTVFLGKGDGTFSKAASSTTNTGGWRAANALQLGDLDGDGNLDMAVTGNEDGLYTFGRTQILLGNGDGTFSAGQSYTSFQGVVTTTESLRLGDIDGDGDLDMAVAGYVQGMENSCGHTWVFLGKGDGTFSEAAAYTSNSGDGWASSHSVRLGDIDGDGALDMAVAGYAASGGGAQVSIFMGKGDGTFSERASLTSDSSGVWANTSSIQLGDLDGDGTLDMVLANQIKDGSDYFGHVQTFISNTREVSTIQRYNLNTRQGALSALTVLKDQLDRIAAERGNIGGFESRLSVALNTLAATRENSIAAASRITDADVAQEAGDLVRMQIVQQAASSVLAQANQQPQIALMLLR